MSRKLIWVALVWGVCFEPAWSETSVMSCQNAVGDSYYADDCGDDALVEEVTLNKTSRLDPAAENPLQGLVQYYSRIYMMAKFKLQDLGIVD